MKKSTTFGLIVTLTLLVFAGKVNSISAQGSYTCVYQPLSGYCENGKENCDDNCEPPIGGACYDFTNNENACLGPHTCSCNPIPTFKPSPLKSLYSVIQTKGGVFTFDMGPGSIVRNIFVFLFPIFGLVLLLFILYGGYSLLLSGGDPKRAQAAKSILTTALIGFVIIFSAYWLVKIIANILGLDEIIDIFS